MEGKPLLQKKLQQINKLTKIQIYFLNIIICTFFSFSIFFCLFILKKNQLSLIDKKVNFFYFF